MYFYIYIDINIYIEYEQYRRKLNPFYLPFESMEYHDVKN